MGNEPGKSLVDLIIKPMVIEKEDMPSGTEKMKMFIPIAHTQLLL